MKHSTQAWLKNHRRLISFWLSAITALCVVISVPTAEVFFCAWFAFVPLLFIITWKDASTCSCFWWGWVSGIFIHAGGFYWMVETICNFGKLPLWVSLLIFTIFISLSAISYGLISAMTHLGYKMALATPVGLAISVVIVEYSFPFLFPWQIAMSQFRIPLLSQTAELWGCFGISGLVALTNGIIFEKIATSTGWIPSTQSIIKRRKAFLALLIAVVVYGAIRITQIEASGKNPNRILKTGIVQPNIKIKEKGNPHYALKHLWLMQSFSSALEQMGAQLIVWPETAYPFKIARGTKRDPSGMRKISAHIHVPLITGAISFAKGSYYNSAYLVTPDEKLIGPADKLNLVLFGEYNPLKNLTPSFIKNRLPPSAIVGLSAGSQPTILSYKKIRAGILNCFEDTLSEYVVKVSKKGANILVNITNDAWFGKTPQPYQHLALSVFRTIENRVPMVRAVNTGVSAYIDAAGFIKYESNIFTQDFKLVDVSLTPNPPSNTPYQMGGYLIGWFLLLVYALWPLFYAFKEKWRKEHEKDRV